MKRDPIQANVLATKLIPNVSPGMAKELNLKPEQRSLALITADCDDVTYTALDEATPLARVVQWMRKRQLPFAVECLCDGAGHRRDRANAVAGKIRAVRRVDADQEGCHLQTLVFPKRKRAGAYCQPA